MVDGCLGFRGPGRPNHPQSPRLAPGGFYWVNTHRWNTGSRGVGPCQSSRRWEAERSPEGESEGSPERAKAGMA